MGSMHADCVNVDVNREATMHLFHTGQLPPLPAAATSGSQQTHPSIGSRSMGSSSVVNGDPTMMHMRGSSSGHANDSAYRSASRSASRSAPRQHANDLEHSLSFQHASASVSVVPNTDSIASDSYSTHSSMVRPYSPPAAMPDEPPTPMLGGTAAAAAAATSGSAGRTGARAAHAHSPLIPHVTQPPSKPAMAPRGTDLGPAVPPHAFVTFNNLFQPIDSISTSHFSSTAERHEPRPAPQKAPGKPWIMISQASDAFSSAGTHQNTLHNTFGAMGDDVPQHGYIHDSSSDPEILLAPPRARKSRPRKSSKRSKPRHALGESVDRFAPDSDMCELDMYDDSTSDGSSSPKLNRQEAEASHRSGRAVVESYEYQPRMLYTRQLEPLDEEPTIHSTLTTMSMGVGGIMSSLGGVDKGLTAEALPSEMLPGLPTSSSPMDPGSYHQVNAMLRKQFPHYTVRSSVT